ncbi:MAG: helix-turn-helix domain-containing protein [Gammaproteobacteria bacterium]
MIEHRPCYLASNLSRLRAVVDCSKEKLAHALGSTGTQIHRLETGVTRNPSFFLIDALANYFGLTTGELAWTDLREVSEQELLLRHLTTGLYGHDSRDIRSALAMLKSLAELKCEKRLYVQAPLRGLRYVLSNKTR